MALFDRRLLAYLDDGGWAGSGTFHDRIVGYQQDLNEIERELYKYQHVLGPGRVKLKARDRRGWFSQHRQSPTTAEIFGNQLEPHPVVSQHQPAQPAVAQAPSVTGAADLVAEPANPARLRRLSAPTASPKPSPKPSPRPSLTEPLQPGTSAPTQPERRQSHRLPVPSRRPSATAEPSPAKVVDVPKVQPKAPAAKAAEAPPAVSEETPLARLQSLPRSELPTHWAQVDTLYLSWDMLLAVGTQLIVRGHWVGKDKETQLDPRAVQAQEGDNQFPQKCKVRQQLKLDGASDVRVIELQILEYRLDGEKVLGKVWLDAMEGDHHKKTVQEPLYGEDGRKLSSQLLVKLATMGSSTVVSQDPVASSAGTKEVPRISVVQAPGAQTGPVVQAVVAGKPAATAEPDPSEQQVSDSNEEEEEEFIYEEAAEEEPPDDDEVVTEDPSKG